MGIVKFHKIFKFGAFLGQFFRNSVHVWDNFTDFPKFGIKSRNSGGVRGISPPRLSFLLTPLPLSYKIKTDVQHNLTKNNGWKLRVYQNTLKFEIQGVHHFSTQEMVPIEATKSFRALSLSQLSDQDPCFFAIFGPVLLSKILNKIPKFFKTI